MALYVEGDRAAFAELFARLAGRVHGFFMRSFRRTSVADDLMQTTFLRMHRARLQYRSGEPLRAWLFAIAANVRFDELRRRYRLPEHATEDSLETLDNVVSDAASADERIDAAERDAAVRSALDQLPESQRVVIHLHRFEGLSFAEIGKVLSSSEGAVRTRAFRGYETLRSALSELAREDQR